MAPNPNPRLAVYTGANLLQHHLTFLRPSVKGRAILVPFTTPADGRLTEEAASAFRGARADPSCLSAPPPRSHRSESSL